MRKMFRIFTQRKSSLTYWKFKCTRGGTGRHEGFKLPSYGVQVRFLPGVQQAGIAQLARALAFQAGGCGFESHCLLKSRENQ
jgi:hypothetical protein